MKYGAASSAREETADAVELFLANHAVPEGDGGKSSFRLRVGAFSYIYSEKDKLVRKEPLPYNELAALKLPERHDEKELEAFKEFVLEFSPVFASATGTAGIYKEITRVLEEHKLSRGETDLTIRSTEGLGNKSEQTLLSKIAKYLVLPVVAAIGVEIGYHLSHSDEEVFNSDILEKTLMDPINWSTIASFVDDCKLTIWSKAVREAAFQNDANKLRGLLNQFDATKPKLAETDEKLIAEFKRWPVADESLLAAIKPGPPAKSKADSCAALLARVEHR